MSLKRGLEPHNAPQHRAASRISPFKGMTHLLLPTNCITTAGRNLIYISIWNFFLAVPILGIKSSHFP